MRKNFAGYFALFVSICLLRPGIKTSHAQTTPFLSDDEIRMLTNEISGDRAFEHIRWLTHWHRDSGMEGFFGSSSESVSEIVWTSNHLMPVGF